MAGEWEGEHAADLCVLGLIIVVLLYCHFENQWHLQIGKKWKAFRECGMSESIVYRLIY